MSLISLSRKAGESELAFIKRLGEAKDAGLLDMTWADLANVFNKELREPGNGYTESAYRKKYAAMKEFKDEFGSAVINSAEADELVELRRELEKEKVKVRDERNQYKKLIRDEARKESYMDQFIRSIEEAAGKNKLDYEHDKQKYSVGQGDSALIIPLYDLHVGIEINNHWNRYDQNVLKERLNNYLCRIFEIQERHGADCAFVCCSELLSGIIHTNLRIQNNQDLIDQFLIVTDYVCDFLAELSYKFKQVNVFVAPGNHSRLNPKKDQDLAHENMDNLVLPFIRAKMQNFDNIECFDNLIEQSIAFFPVCNINVAAIHGDKDSMENAAEKMGKFLGMRVDLIITGHKHTNKLFTSNDVKCVQTGCLSGSDEYALNNRMRNRPEQAVCVITERDGLDCIYDIKF